jgi:hypothetical protein
MAVSRWFLLALSAAVLSGCSEVNRIYAPLAQTPVAWNDADDHPIRRTGTRHHTVKPAKILDPNSADIVGSVGDKTPEPALKPYSKEWLAREEAIDREANAALVKKMRICRDC